MDDLSGKQTLGKRPGDGWLLAEGDTLGGYRIVNPLGRGGMGEVCTFSGVGSCCGAQESGGGE